jgi:hypothetical protein
VEKQRRAIIIWVAACGGTGTAIGRAMLKSIDTIAERTLGAVGWGAASAVGVVASAGFCCWTSGRCRAWPT